jgi:acyl-CoA hydrolase
MSVNSVFRLVDSGTNQKPVMAQTGTVLKTREVAATSLVANDQNVTYTLSMKFTNPIPSGGSIKITLTDSAMVGNSALLVNSCYRLDFSNRPTSLVCKATPTSIEVTVSSPAFDSKGLAAGDEF